MMIISVNDSYKFQIQIMLHKLLYIPEKIPKICLCIFQRTIFVNLKFISVVIIFHAFTFKQDHLENNHPFY